MHDIIGFWNRPIRNHNQDWPRSAVLGLPQSSGMFSPLTKLLIQGFYLDLLCCLTNHVLWRPAVPVSKTVTGQSWGPTAQRCKHTCKKSSKQTYTTLMNCCSIMLLFCSSATSISSALKLLGMLKSTSMSIHSLCCVILTMAFTLGCQKLHSGLPVSSEQNIRPTCFIADQAWQSRLQVLKRKKTTTTNKIKTRRRLRVMLCLLHNF